LKLKLRVASHPFSPPPPPSNSHPSTSTHHLIPSPPLFPTPSSSNSLEKLSALGLGAFFYTCDGVGVFPQTSGRKIRWRSASAKRTRICSKLKARAGSRWQSNRTEASPWASAHHDGALPRCLRLKRSGNFTIECRAIWNDPRRRVPSLYPATDAAGPIHTRTYR